MIDRLARFALAIVLAVFLIGFALKVIISGLAGLLLVDE